ncbi:MAG TPA: hypothetical protein VJZ77_04290, partial [Blastocatellia bacterium]|nr:hypothetical protein [Blastocatellia bacterium]
MFARFTPRKVKSVASRLSSWVSNSNTLSKPNAKENKRRTFKTHLLGNRALLKLWHSKRALLVVALLASSAAALTSLGIRRAMQSGNNAAFVSQSVPATMTA